MAAAAAAATAASPPWLTRRRQCSGSGAGWERQALLPFQGRYSPFEASESSRPQQAATSGERPGEAVVQPLSGGLASAASRFTGAGQRRGGVRSRTATDSAAAAAAPAPAGGAADAVNENWPIVSCDGQGDCSGAASNEWAPRASALSAGLSIVIHDTPNNGGAGSGAKMLCGDLAAAKIYSGAFTRLASFEPSLAYAGMSGSAELIVGSHGIRTAPRVTATDASTLADMTFKAHLHAAPCSAAPHGSAASSTSTATPSTTPPAWRSASASAPSSARSGCVFRGTWAVISRDLGHAFQAIVGSHFTVVGRLVDKVH